MAQAVGRAGRLGQAAFVLVGVVCLCICAWQALRTTTFLHSALQAQGTVAPDSPGSTQTMSGGHPAITFRTSDGRDIRYVQNGMGSTRIGASVRVRYLAADPAGTAQVGAGLSLWTPVLLPGVMGLGFLLLPLLGAEIGVRGRW